MEFKYSKESLERIEECHEDLQLIAMELIKHMNVVVLCGYRGEREQNSAFINGFSKQQWPRSKHNSIPSRAIDIAPYPTNWDDIESFKNMCELVEHIASQFNIKIRLGRDFSFRDFPHIELA